MRIIPLTVSIALVVSTLEAVIFLPSHYADWPGGEINREASGRRGRVFEILRKGFSALLTRVYRRRKLAVLVILLISIGAFSLVPFLKQDLFSAEDFTLFYIDIDLPPGSSLDRTEGVIRAYEDRLLPLVGNGEIAGINSFIGNYFNGHWFATKFK